MHASEQVLSLLLFSLVALGVGWPGARTPPLPRPSRQPPASASCSWTMSASRPSSASRAPSTGPPRRERSSGLTARWGSPGIQGRTAPVWDPERQVYSSGASTGRRS